MPTAEKVFTVERPIQLVWGFLSDMVWLGSCVPGCEKVEVLNETDSAWTVKVKLGPVSKTLRATARTIEAQPPRLAKFTAIAQELRLEGSLELRAVTPVQTEVTYRTTAKGMGPLEKLLEQIMSGRIRDDADAFASSIQARIALEPV